jgi:hypothetical protein
MYENIIQNYNLKKGKNVRLLSLNLDKAFYQIYTLSRELILETDKISGRLT